MKEQGQEMVVQEREDVMVSSSGGRSPVRRTAHFLTPSLTSNDDSSFHLPPHPISTRASDPLVAMNFRRWANPRPDWKEWVELMHPKHHALWKKVGIFEAVLNSKYTIHRDDDLIHAFAAWWCCKANTFLFPWAEATLTLEDMTILGGYSVLGAPVFSPLENQEMNRIERKLELSRSEISKCKARKASHGAWLGKFMASGSEIEHEAFLVYWLSRFVFPLAADSILKCVFPIAIHLAQGTKIALAPAVLASIYSDLNQYKEAILVSRKLVSSKCQHHVEDIFISAPFNLVQIWVWERFPIFRPNPNNLKPEEPTFARWHGLRGNSGRIVANVIEKAADCFEWRPYTTVVQRFFPKKMKREDEQCLSFSSGTDEEVEALIRCLRVSELVGIDGNCIEQYLPHRVARQFGLDQDIPVVVERRDSDQRLAWENYNRPISDGRFCIPSCPSESNVTIRYLEWWKKSVSAQDGGDSDASEDRIDSMRLRKQKLLDSARNMPEDDVCAGEGLLTTCNAVKEKDLRSKEARQSSVYYPKDSNTGSLDYSLISSKNETSHPLSSPSDENTVKENGAALDGMGVSKYERRVLLQSSENASPGSSTKCHGESENDLKRNRDFVNGVSYKRLMKRMALRSPAKKSAVDDLVPPGFVYKCNTASTRSLDDKDVEMEYRSAQPIQSNVQIASKELNSTAFVAKTPDRNEQNDGRSLSKVSLFELEARIFNLERVLDKYKRGRGLA